jgi:penicillin-binding protein 1A
MPDPAHHMCIARSVRPRSSTAAILQKCYHDHAGLFKVPFGRSRGGRESLTRLGGSTITQQVVKNLLVGDELTYERKIREMVVASRVEHTLSKAEILELYLNSVYLGRGAWGIELAARSYFGKSGKDLSLEEGALLAGLTKGPNSFSPDRHPGRAQERLAYVLSHLREDGVIPPEQVGRGLPALPTMLAYERPHRDIGFHFIDQVAREAKWSRALRRLRPILIRCARRSARRCSAT